MSLIDVVLFWPTIFKLFYVHRVISIYKSFFADSNEERAKTKIRKVFLTVLLIAAAAEVLQLGFTFTVAFEESFRELFCQCSLVSNSNTVAASLVMVIGYSFEILALMLFSWPLCSPHITLKYKIKQELLATSMCLALTRIAALVSLTHFNCYLILDHFLEEPEYYVTLVLLVLIFSLQVFYPLWTIRNFREGPNILTLILDFPEALYFWTPNFYFDLFLRRGHPSHARYRPFIADILRYDFQIGEPSIRKATSRTYSGEWIPISEPNSKEMVDLAVYMKRRYLVEESPGYCDF